MSKSDVFDILAFVLAAAFAFAMWPPAALGVAAVACWAAGRAAHK